MVLALLSFLITGFFTLRFIMTAKEERFEHQAPVEVSHRVLFISSNSSLYFTYDSQASGLQKSLYPNGIEYDVLFMDGNSRGNATFDMFADYFKARYNKLYRYEAVLVGGNEALRFVMEYQDEIFARLPIVFFCISDYNLACRAAKNPYMSGFYENDYLNETINLATSLFPKRKTLIALHDQSSAGSNDSKMFWSLRDKYPGYFFSDLDTSLLSQTDLVSLLESLPSDALLFYLSCYTDKSGNVYSMLSRTSTIVRSSNVPIFRNYEGGEDMGILGGVHMDIENQCMMAGDMVVSILQGTEISSMSLVEQTPSRTSFDYTLGKHYGLDFKLLPEDTVFYNQPDTFINHYGKILPIGIMFFVTMLFLVAYLRVGKFIANVYVKELKASTERLVESQELLVYQAEHDEILDVLNRRTITDWIRSSMTENSVYSVVIIDIDDFKMLNENYGHSMADSILQYLVALLKGIVDEGGWKLARFGGDELIIVIPDENIEMECPIVRQLFSTIRAPIPLGDETLAITASIGASCSDGHTPPEQHIINAEAAMYEAKTRGKNGIVIYDDKMKEKALEEIRIKEKLQSAFDNDGFFMLYQPQIDAQTKLVSGYEALVRMKEPGIYPGQFIPVAERSGWIWRIGRITTELVIKQLAAWRDAGKTLHPVSVNFSSNQLNDHGYVDFVEDLLRRYDIPPEYLEIEITEGLFLEKSALADEVFERFKNMGIRLLMDDFGTGYSSLGYLTYIPVDVIKLDKSLVDTYLVDGKDSFIKNIIHLMHDLNKDMIIEGVEEEWQYKRLCDFGADTIQGYFFSKPIPADEAISFKVKEA